jgi:hypothetical protein
VSSVPDVPLLLVPGDPTELPVVVAVPWSLVLLPMELEPLVPWFWPLEVPMELLPALDPERLVPAEPELVVLDPELPDEPDEPDEPEL